jgi:hypothetical protein
MIIDCEQELSVYCKGSLIDKHYGQLQRILSKYKAGDGPDFSCEMNLETKKLILHYHNNLFKRKT